MKALITGVAGQDGSYLAEFLLKKNYQVFGIDKRRPNQIRKNLESDSIVKAISNGNFTLIEGDVTDSFFILSILQNIKPDEFYNLAAQSHVGHSFNTPHLTANIDGLAALGALEAIKALKLKTKFYQASTSELFGSTPPPQSENSYMYPRSPYAVSKLYAYWTTKVYRDAYGIHATNGILFNHESPRRGHDFVTRKISLAAAQAKKNLLKGKVKLGNSQSIRDWGYAPEYVESMYLMLQNPEPLDLVVATGKPASVHDFAEKTFKYLGLDVEEFIEFDSVSEFRPLEVDNLVGDTKRAKSLINWSHKTSWSELAEILVEFDLNNI